MRQLGNLRWSVCSQGSQQRSSTPWPLSVGAAFLLPAETWACSILWPSVCAASPSALCRGLRAGWPNVGARTTALRWFRPTMRLIWPSRMRGPTATRCARSMRWRSPFRPPLTINWCLRRRSARAASSCRSTPVWCCSPQASLMNSSWLPASQSRLLTKPLRWSSDTPWARRCGVLAPPSSTTSLRRRISSVLRRCGLAGAPV